MNKLLIFVALCASAHAQVVISACAFAGSGLNDATCGGKFISAPGNHSYVVTISATGTPDHFTWTKDGGSASSAIAITGAAQALSDGVSITFAATTGHTASNSWTITTTASGSLSAQSVIQRGIGAIFRDAQEQARENVSVLGYGADATGTRDSSAAFKNAWDFVRNYAPGNAGTVNVPCGTYLINSTVQLSHAYMGRLIGAGGCTQFVWGGPAVGPMFLEANCFTCTVEGFRIIVSSAHPLQAGIQTENDGSGVCCNPTADRFQNIEIEGNGYLTFGVLIAGPNDGNNDQQHLETVKVYGYTRAAFRLGLPTSIGSVTAASWSSGTATYTVSGLGDTGLTTGDFVIISGASPSGYNGTFAVTVISPTQFTTAIASNPGAWTSGGDVGATNTGFNIFNVVFDHCSFVGGGGLYGVENQRGNFSFSNGDGGTNSGADFFLATLGNGGYHIENLELEDSAQFLKSGGPGGISSFIDISNVAWSAICLGDTTPSDVAAGCPTYTPSGKAISWLFLGPLTIRSSQFGTTTPVDLQLEFGQNQVTNPGVRLEDCIFGTTNTTPGTLFSSQAPTVSNNNSYYDAGGTTHLYPSVWAQPQTFGVITGSFTPDLNFGGANTGITYSVQQGNYWQSGGITTLVIFISLTSKGSATGIATIDGLPFTASVGGAGTFGAFGDATILDPLAIVIGGTTQVELNIANGGATLRATDANFSNTTNIFLTVTYN